MSDEKTPANKRQFGFLALAKKSLAVIAASIGTLVPQESKAIPITNDEIQDIVTTFESNVQEVNIEESRENIISDINTLESGIGALEEASHEEVAQAIESSTESAQAETEEAPSSEVSGSAVLDVLKLMERLSK